MIGKDLKRNGLFCCPVLRVLPRKFRFNRNFRGRISDCQGIEIIDFAENDLLFIKGLA